MSSKKRSLTASRKEEELNDIEQKTAEVTKWIEDQLKEKLPKSLRESLLDGVVLCKLINALKPNALKRYHKKPRMLMMKMENIAFFLTASASRFSLPQSVLFAPTDIHDDSDPASMRKVLNVLYLIKEESSGGNSAAQAAMRLEEEERKREEAIKAEIEQDRADGFVVEDPKKPTAVMELNSRFGVEEGGDPPGEDSDKEVEETDGRKMESETEADLYLQGQMPSQYTECQNSITNIILQTSNTELSIHSKQKLIQILKNQTEAIQQKIISASDEEVRKLAHSMGLGQSLSDLPTNKGRQWYVDYILKYGRIK